MQAVRIMVLAGAIGFGLAASAAAQDPATEKQLVANERAINEAVVKGDAAAFKQYVAADGWSMDGMTGRMAVADFLKEFDQMSKDMKVTSWDITDAKTIWANPSTAIQTYKWTGSGTYQGQPIPSPTWCSTVWTKRDGKWMAVFHQESASMPAPANK